MSLPEKNSSQEITNKTVIESFVEEIFNNHNLLAIEKYLNPFTGKGSEGYKQFLSTFFKAFPDWHAEIEQIVAESKFVVIFLNGSGTHQGEFRGIPPTHKIVKIRSADLYK